MYMKLPSLQVGDLIAKLPIIQGAMGVGVSRSGLAGAVANEGGIGVISGVQIGFQEKDFETNTLEANIRALKNEIRKAREISPKGIIGVNFLVAMNNYEKIAKAAVEEGIDLIISGAGLPTMLPSIVEGFKTKIAPIVSSGKAAAVICKMWDKRHGRVPDLVVVEGPDAGGHLGYTREELISGERHELSDILVEVIKEVKVYEDKYGKAIPVVAAGGIYTGKDIAKYINLGASGVQMATRFIATEECDADIRYKQAFIEAKEEDIQIVKSPVGMPGRAIRNKLIKDLEVAPIKITRCYNCLRPCNPADTPYCISKALINAVEGNLEEGLIFTGTNGYRIDKIVPVKELIDELVREAEAD
jgi:nitronate monooxygenase